MEQPAYPSDSLSRVRERVRVGARALRQQHTSAQDLLWSHLRGRRFMGLKFRREHPIGSFFVDFACIEAGLVIEIDGGQHVDAAAYDARRAAAMQENGFRTLRLWNHDVLTETGAVLERLRQELTLTPALSRTREREQDKEAS